MTDCNDILRFLDEHWPKINKNPSDLDVYFPRKRKIAENEAKNDLEKTIEHLLADIHDESLDDQSRSREMTVARTMARFAALQIKLSKEADETASKNLNLVKYTFGVAIIALLVSIIQLFLPFINKEYGFNTKEDSIQVRYQRTYDKEDLKEFEKTHDVPSPFPKK